MKRIGPVALACASLACEASTPSPSGTPACEGVELLVAASDYSSSLVCGAPSCAGPTMTTGLDLGKDPQLASTNGRAFFVARDNDVLFELDPSCGTPKAKVGVHDAATTGNANPHDVAAAEDGTLFVTLYGTPRVAMVREGRIETTIDVSGYDADGNPQTDAIRIMRVGEREKAFVTLERLDDADRLRSKQSSMMLRIDVASRTVEAAIELEGRNPFNAMAEHAGALFLAMPGNFDAAEEPLAGIERFDTTTSTSRLLVHERDLGGSVSEIAVTEGCGVAIVAGSAPDVNPTSLVTFDPVTGRALMQASAPVLGPTEGYDLQGLAWRERTLYVGDRRRGPSGYRVHVFERDDGACTLHSTGTTIDLPQRPVALRASTQRR